MNFTVNDLTQMRQTSSQREEQARVDRAMYVEGKQGYPTAPNENLSERARDCYMMGYNTSEWESNNV